MALPFLVIIYTHLQMYGTLGTFLSFDAIYVLAHYLYYVMILKRSLCFSTFLIPIPALKFSCCTCIAMTYEWD